MPLTTPVALLVLTDVQYTGNFVGSSFNINIFSSGETISMDLTVNLGKNAAPNWNIIGVPESLTGVTTVPVSMGIQGNDPSIPAQGQASDSFTLLSNFPTQQFIVNLIVNSINGPATFTLTFTSTWREYPVSYPMSWLCNNRYNFQAFHRWLCLGSTQIPNFYQNTSVQQLQAIMTDAAPVMHDLSNRLSLGYVPQSSSFFDLLKFNVDVMLASAPTVSTLNYRWGYTIADFGAAVEQVMGNYIGNVVPLLDPLRWTLCNKWRDLLDCLCAYCAQTDVPNPPPHINHFFNSQVAPVTSMVYSHAVTWAQTEGLNYYMDPYLADQCAQLRNLVGFWAWWCRTCTSVTVSWQQQAEDDFSQLFSLRAQFKALLEMEAITLCDPSEKDFCDRWSDLLECLMELCERRAGFSSYVRQQMENLFGADIRDLYMLLKHPQPQYPATDLATMCGLIRWLYDYFVETICPDRTIPGGEGRRSLLDFYLGQLEHALLTFKSNSGDLCAPDVPLSDCEEWTEIIDCLKSICDRKSTLSTVVLDDFYDLLHWAVDDLYWLMQGIEYGPISLDLLEMCRRLNVLHSLIHSFCPSTPVSRSFRDYMAYRLVETRNALNSLKGLYPDICSDADPCDEWLEILHCLARICERHEELSASSATAIIVQKIVNDFGPHLDSLYTKVFQHVPQPQPPYTPAPYPPVPNPPPTPPPPPVEVTCYAVRELLDWFVLHCACNNDIAPALQQELSTIYLPVFRDLYEDLQRCSCNCKTTRFDVTTGEVPWIVTQTDTGVAVPVTANVVTGTCGIASPIIGSEWISPLPTACCSATGWTTFERCFCLCADASVRLAIDFRADDHAEIYIDNVLVKKADQMNMAQPEHLDATFQLTAGRHCIQVKVLNDPAFNMALAVNGYLEDAGGNLLKIECCTETFTPLPGDDLVGEICCKADIACDKLAYLPRVVHLFCATLPDLNDPIIVQVLNDLPPYEAKLPEIIEALGFDPNEMGPADNTFCARLEFLVLVLILAYSNPWALTLRQWYIVDCIYKWLHVRAMSYVLTMSDAPRACQPCFDLCDRWLVMLNCLCRLCTNGEKLAEHGLADDFDAIICDEINSLYTYISGIASSSGAILYPLEEPTGCCEQLRRIVTLFAQICMGCGRLSGVVIVELENRYKSMHSEFIRLADTLDPAGLDICDDFCERYVQMLECLLQFCLRHGELPASFNTRFDGLFESHIMAIHKRIFSSTPAPTPFPSGSFGNTCWTLFGVLRSFGWLCSPYYEWDLELRLDLEAILPALTADYNTFNNELAAAGYHICGREIDYCERLDRLPDLYAIICGSIPLATHPPIVVLEMLLAKMAPEVPSLQRQLRLPSVAYPFSAVFCERLRFVLGLVAAAYSRPYQLDPTYLLMADLFYGLLVSQSAAYAALIGSELPRATTVDLYRAQWTDLLGCLCRTCDFVEGLNAAERATYSGIVEMVEDDLGEPALLIEEIYDTVVAISATHNLPLNDDPCADTLCRRLRIIISFFSIYCLDCEGPAPADAVLLDAHLEHLRVLATELRIALFEAGRGICAEEDMGSVLIQSPSLYLQAAGSSAGGDGSASGVHLRWALLGDLADHLPKGNLAKPGSANYGSNKLNKSDDFVRIYRAPYRAAVADRFVAEIDFAATLPTRISGSIASGVEWVYENIRVDTRFSDARTSVIISFEPELYPLAVPTSPSEGHVKDVLQNYTGIYKVMAIPKTMFAFELLPEVTAGTPSAKFEAISSIDDPNADIPLFVSCRETISGVGSFYRITSESIDHVLFKCVNCVPRTIRLETYDDFYLGTKRRYLWSRIGEYALSLDTPGVYKRLEDPVNYPIDGLWPKYETLGGHARVSVENYKDRWDPHLATYDRDDSQSLRDAVERYIQLSKSADNLLASCDVPSIIPGDKTYMNLSLLQLLQLAAQDYHVARMLGLGCIDYQVPLLGDGPAHQYIYFAEYQTASDPGNGVTSQTHRYLSLPTGRYDYRLPVAPEIDSLELGLDDDFTDNQGYTRFGSNRFVRLHKKPLKIDQPVGGFYQSTDQFSRGKNTRPLLFGVKFGDVTGGVTGGAPIWEIPDPSNDLGEHAKNDFKPYRDAQGYPEVMPIPDMPNPFYIHRIQNKPENTGLHVYGIYGINWFSRVSSVVKGPEINNQFPVRNTLLPPLNLSVQYIQPEEPPLFTSPSEQDSAFFGKTRVTFDWNHIHNKAYQKANAVDLYFRSEEPARVNGMIGEVTVQTLPLHTARVQLTSYTEIAEETPRTVEPTIAAADYERFKGSMLVTATNSFTITKVEAGTNGYPLVTIELLVPADAAGNRAQGTPIAPRASETFLIVENMMGMDEAKGITAGWQRLTSHRIMLADFNAHPYTGGGIHTETTYEDGREVVSTIGGFVDPNGEVKRVGTVPGVFEVIMPGTTLHPYDVQHSGAVSFYKGTARIPNYQNAEDIRVVEVLRIETEVRGGEDRVKLYVMDKEEKIAPANGAMVTATVNFHPSYRAYINWSAEGVAAGDIMPTSPETSRITYIAAKSVDTTHAEGMHPYRSGLSAPAVHLARLIIDPQAPAAPTGPLYATRPDIYGKATFMFDTEIPAGRTVYAMHFYRADEMAILATLYKQPTIVDEILPNLPRRDTDPYLADRWLDLILVRTEMVNGEKLFIARSTSTEPGAPTFRFPKPDRSREGYESFKGNASLQAGDGDIKRAIEEAFLPLTESPVIYQQIKENASLQTSSKKPVLHRDGALLALNDADYDAFPMARRGTRVDGRYVVRFADYTLDGASRNIYFYFTREFGNMLKAGSASQMLGPVRLVNSVPPVAPEIGRVRAQPENQVLGTSPSVTFEFNRYPSGENLKKVRLYRATSEEMAQTIRLMDEVGTFDLPENLAADKLYRVVDTFADLKPGESVPYGQPLFYRLVVLREIRNEEAVLEYVPSIPSELVLVSIMDTVNPPAPAINADEKVTVMALPPNGTKVLKYTDVVFTWDNVTYNALYTLYKMSSQGQWVKMGEVVRPQGDTVSYNWPGELLKLDENGQVIYHRFKIGVINSSGLVNVEENVLVV